jgi:hypothetical protein
MAVRLLLEKGADVGRRQTEMNRQHWIGRRRTGKKRWCSCSPPSVKTPNQPSTASLPSITKVVFVISGITAASAIIHDEILDSIAVLGGFLRGLG